MLLVLGLLLARSYYWLISLENELVMEGFCIRMTIMRILVLIDAKNCRSPPPQPRMLIDVWCGDEEEGCVLKFY